MKDEAAAETTQTFTPEEARGRAGRRLEDLGIKGPALVVRSGGGRAGETFHPEGEDDDRPLARLRDLPRRRHRLAQARGADASATAASSIDDQGSLNGTFVNRKRIESAQLEDGDELQIGKYRLTFLSR